LKGRRTKTAFFTKYLKRKKRAERKNYFFKEELKNSFYLRSILRAEAVSF